VDKFSNVLAVESIAKTKPGVSAMAKGQMRSNKEKKKPKADKNKKKGGAAPSPFAAGNPGKSTPAGKKS
jgi:hypothetical protein